MRVLLIDDDLVDRETIKRALKQQVGTIIEEASSAGEGLAALTNIKFDIVLLDYLLPDKDGLQVLSDIRALKLAHPCAVIMMSNSEDNSLLENALEFGAQDFLAKDEIGHLKLKRSIHLARKRFELEYYVLKSVEHSKRVAKTDLLTNLLNRSAFETVLEKNLPSAETDAEVGVLLIDVDNFKFFNECYGHEIGDQLLKQVGERIRQVADHNMHLARIGSNEFALLYKSAGGDIKTRKLLGRLLKTLDVSFFLDDVEINCSFSIGSTVVNNATSIQEVIKQANLALHKAKQQSGYSVFEFNECLSAEIETQRQIKEGLEYHLSKDEFQVVYQPIVNKKGEVASIEALVRWPQNSQFGFFRPDEFIAVAEQNQTIERLGEFVFGQALETLSRLKQQGNAEMKVSVNLSPVQLNQWELCVKLVGMCKRLNIEPNNVVLEITETALLSNDFATRRMIAELAHAGFIVSLDDFGTGYSSISHLINFPIKQVKVDRSVVPAKPDDSRRTRVLSSIVKMCQSIGAMVVVEGIEEAWQAELCRDFGADKQQGYFFSRPVPEKELFSVIERTEKNALKSVHVNAERIAS